MTLTEISCETCLRTAMLGSHRDIAMRNRRTRSCEPCWTSRHRCRITLMIWVHMRHSWPSLQIEQVPERLKTDLSPWGRLAWLTPNPCQTSWVALILLERLVVSVSRRSMLLEARQIPNCNALRGGHVLYPPSGLEVLYALVIPNIPVLFLMKVLMNASMVMPAKLGNRSRLQRWDVVWKAFPWWTNFCMAEICQEQRQTQLSNMLKNLLAMLGLCGRYQRNSPKKHQERVWFQPVKFPRLPRLHQLGQSLQWPMVHRGRAQCSATQWASKRQDSQRAIRRIRRKRCPKMSWKQLPQMRPVKPMAPWCQMPRRPFPRTWHNPRHPQRLKPLRTRPNGLWGRPLPLHGPAPPAPPAREHHRFQGDPAGSEARCCSEMSQPMGLSQSGVYPKVAQKYKKCHRDGDFWLT